MTIFVTNAGLQILARVTWRRAAVLLTTEVARNVEGTPVVRVVHSPTVTLPIYRAVRSSPSSVLAPPTQVALPSWIFMKAATQ